MFEIDKNRKNNVVFYGVKGDEHDQVKTRMVYSCLEVEAARLAGAVVYFNQRLGAAHSKCLKMLFSRLLHEAYKKEQEVRKIWQNETKTCFSGLHPNDSRGMFAYKT